MATTRYIDIKVRSKSAEGKINKLDNNMKGLGRTVDKTTKEFGKLSSVASGIALALTTAQITKYADAFTSIQNQLRQTTKTTQQLEQATTDLLGVANRSRTEFQATAELYTQLNLSTENLNLSTEELLRLTETIGKSFAVSGKSAAESSGAIRQLGQAFSAGALRGDEFNSIAEGAPEIMRALQRSLNKTQGELRSFAATGGITAEVLVKALGGAADVIDNKMAKATQTLAQSLQEANNNMTDFVGNSTAVKNVVGGAGQAIVSASENIELIASSATVLASVFAARLIPSMIAYTSGIIANTQAQLVNGTAATRTANIYGVVSVAQARATVTTNALTIASRGLSASMAFLGGPLGVALIAATALIAFNVASDDTAESASLSAQEVDELSKSFGKLSSAAKKATLSNINNQMELLRAELIQTNESLVEADKLAIRASASGSGFALLNARAESLRERVASINSELNTLSDKQGILIGGPDLSGGTNRGDISEGESAASKKASSSFVNRLAQETEALRLELQLRKAIRDGIVSEEEAIQVQRVTAKLTASQASFDAEMLKLGEDELAKEELRAQFREIQLLNVQEFEANLTDIKIAEEEKRLDVVEDAANAENSIRNNVINNAVGLLQVLGRESKAAALIGIVIAKAQALSANAVATASGSTLAFAAQQVPGDPTSFARGTAAAAKVKTLGSLNAALIAATGLGQGASVLSGGSGALGATSSGGSFSSPQNQPQNQSASQTRVIDVRIDDDAILSGSAVKNLIMSVVENDDDVVATITNAQQELVRVGGIQ